MSNATVADIKSAPQAKILPANYIRVNGNDFAYRSWYVNGLPAGHSFSDLFHPYYWALTRVVKNDIVRVASVDGSWDVQLKCTETEIGGGAHMELWPKYPAELLAETGSIASEAAAIAEATHELGAATMPRELYGLPVPRVEQVDKTFSLIGLNGHPIKQNIDSKAKADKELAAYAKRMKIEL